MLPLVEAQHICRRPIHRSAWRNCLENSRRRLTAPLWRQEAPESGLLRPLLAALGAPIRDLSRISKQFRRDCLKSPDSLETKVVEAYETDQKDPFCCGMQTILAHETPLSDFLDSFGG